MIPQVRIFVGDSIKASTNDILDPVPDGITTIFHTTLFPLASVPYDPLLYSLSNPISATRLSASDWTILDSENGIIKLTSPPPASIDYVLMEYYTWSFFSDATIQASLNSQGGDIRYAAVDILNSILADPQGAFFKLYQTGDDTVNDAQFSIPRVQSLRDEILRQTRLPENAGSGWSSFRGMDAIFQSNNIVDVQLNNLDYLKNPLGRGLSSI